MIFLDQIVLCPGQYRYPRTRPVGKNLSGPAPARISESVLEPEPELPKALGQFKIRIFLNVSSDFNK